MKKRKSKPGRAPNSGPSTFGAAGSDQNLRRNLRTASAGIWLALAGACFFLLAESPSIAKEKKISRTVSGIVLDKDENGIPRATITLTDLQTNKKIAIYASEDGHYQFFDLDPRHDYEVQASYQGNTSKARKVSSFDSRSPFVINLHASPPSP